ncbi:Mitogen-activated protein kinase kinase kinase 2 [Diplonema papillatum]|nr:Mitogen-activated protein kinase kinase kinase 2 [Diplonema papillatum]|eukprot:gene6942-10677_t
MLTDAERNETQQKHMDYMRSIELHKTIDVMIRRVLEQRPDSREAACYEMHVAAAYHYPNLVSDDEEEDEEEEEAEEQAEVDVAEVQASPLQAEPEQPEEYEEEELGCGLKKGAIIGSGAFGKVYKALDHLGTVYAVKVIPNTAGVDSSSAASEYATLKQLSHRNIVRVWDFVVGLRFSEIVMSYWTQGSVAHQILEFGALPPYTVRKYARQVLNGLGYLHSCRVLHRDMKPQNMLVDTTGSVALTDFGLSTTQCSTHTHLDSEKGSLQIVGSPPYLSPRIVREVKYSEQSDFWALGCSLLEIATARITWSGVPFGEVNNCDSWSPQEYLDVAFEAAETGTNPLQFVDDKNALPSDLCDFVSMCFEAEKSAYLHKDLRKHPFLGEVMPGAMREAVIKKLPFYRYDRQVLSGSVTIYLSARNSLRVNDERRTVVDAIATGALSQASPFSRMDIRRAGEGDGFNNASLDRKRMYPHRKRPAHTLLSLLKRAEGRPDIEPGLPDVSFPKKFLDLNEDSQVICISGETIDAVSRDEKERGVSPDGNMDTDNPADQPSAAAVYGTGSFQITVGELKRLARSTYVSTTSEIPTQFFSALVAFTTTKEHQLFWSAHRAVPLTAIGKRKEEEELSRMLHAEISRTTRVIDRLRTEEQTPQAVWELKRAMDHREQAKSHLTAVIAFENGPAGRDDGAADKNADKRGHAGLNLAPASEKWRDVLDQFDAWRHHVFLFPYDNGFSSSADAKAVLDQSLTELGTSVCVSQLGYFLVDGVQGDHNQLATKTPQPVVFLAATGLDFSKSSTTMREASKYFVKCDQQSADGSPNAGARWKGFLPVADHRLKERIKELYRVIFSCAKHHSVKNLSMLSMGLGILLANVHQTDRVKVAEAYFRAQFELLSESDWGFEGYYLNPGPPDQKETALSVLEEVLGGGGKAPATSFLSCDIIFHGCDAKFLAAEFAKRRMSAAMLCPSDCASVTLGQMGTFWETGRGNLHSCEQEFISHTTGILAREGIAEFWSSGASVV